MSGLYASQHASASRVVGRKGSAVTFTRTVPTYDATTNTMSAAVVTTITGSAVRVKGNPIRYAALTLTLSEAATLFVTPDTYGALPLTGDVVVFGGATYTVRDVDPVAPDGVAIAAKIVVQRGGDVSATGAAA